MTQATSVPYLVVWRGDEDNFLQSSVWLDTPPENLTNGEWVYRAALTEDYSTEDAETLLESGYELILVCPMPSVFYEN